ncbi:DMT family transporter [Salinisphaera sp. T31B1]|uniref:DMT family transporter n=1 Tax=Salinisphaera sp. T31B1 TaxID=727963 RepID=UPI00333EAEAC
MKDELRRGAAFAMAGAASFAVMSALIKQVGPELPNPVIVFFRNLFALLALLPWLGMLTRSRPSLTTRRPGMHLLRAATGLGAMYCFFYALSDLPLASAVLLNYSQPLFLPFIAWAWIGERPPTRIYPAVLIGFLGVILILKPGLGWAGPAGLAGLAAGVLAATSMAAIRRMADTEPTVRIVLYFSVLGTVLSLLPALAVWQTPTRDQWVTLLGAGSVGTAGQLLLTQAYSLAPAAHIGSLIYTTVLFAALIGWALWNETPDLLSLLGGLAVIAAALIVVVTRRSRRPDAPAGNR